MGGEVPVSTLAVPRPISNPYHRIDAAWKSVVTTGPRWFMDHVWHTCLTYVRASNAFPRPSASPYFDREAVDA
jgi:hypothetical protein